MLPNVSRDGETTPQSTAESVTANENSKGHSKCAVCGLIWFIYFILKAAYYAYKYE